MKFALKNFSKLLAVLALTTAPGDRVVAITQAEATAECIQKVAPTIPACVRWKTMERKGAAAPKDEQECRAHVRRCTINLVMPGASGFKPSVLDTSKTPAVGTSENTAQTLAVPPRTISDITAILDQERPDPVRLAKLKESADAVPPANADRVTLAHFYNRRANIRSELGRFREAVEDGERAVELASGRVGSLVLTNFRTLLARQYQFVGEPKKALVVNLKMVEDGERSGEKAYHFIAYRDLIHIELAMGNYDRAQTYLRKAEELWKQAASILGYQYHASKWKSNIEGAKGRLHAARGEFEAAVRSYQSADALRRKGIDDSRGASVVNPRSVHEEEADLFLLNAAIAKSKLGRFAEAESDARRALLNRLQATGKYYPQTATYIAALGSLLVEQGRYGEAKKLIKATIDIYRELDVSEDSHTYVTALSDLASVQALEGRWAEAAESYTEVERATQNWEPLRRGAVLDTYARIETHYKTGQIEAGLAAGRRLLDFRIMRLGEQHADTALARGHYAVGLARAKRDAEALKEFAESVPLLTGTTFNTDTDDAINAAARTRYTQLVVETYIDLLGRLNPTDSADVASETFQLADTIRSRAVQKALTASAARMNASDPKLTAFVRQEQDLRQQIGTQLGQINVLLSLPSSQRDEAGVSDLRKRIDKMRADHARVRADLDRLFPNYAELIDPKPPSITEIQKALRPDEAFVSIYVGRESSFVWAVPKVGPAAFVTLSAGGKEIEAKVKILHDGLIANVVSVGNLPPFDLAVSHELYVLLLKPVEAGWQSAKSLIVSTNGALGLLPLAMLPTAPSEVNPDADPLFVDYRNVPWLARSHATTFVPSAAAFITLRQLPAASARREKLVGFGDPFFSVEQAAEAAKEIHKQAASLDAPVSARSFPLRRRSAPQTQALDSADLALLPRLPDTADELKSIAVTLEADPLKALHLGKEANEGKVKSLELSKFKIIAFATHGLVPGDLNGLTQPALALTAPSVAGTAEDGLLTMEEILALKLDADWVILSACNTGTGAAEGAEAASGLGRAFFYAGTRAILVTNWSVHSESARDLVSDLFRRQTADPTITRAEALRRAMMALLDGKGFTDEKGATIFTYAHPLFWAPYTIIGDGG